VAAFSPHRLAVLYPLEMYLQRRSVVTLRVFRMDFVLVFALFTFAPVLFSGGVWASDWYEAAKKEKQVVWYTSLNVSDNEKIVAAFVKKYPGVEVNVNRQSANSVLQKVLTERRAGKDIADVVLVGAEYLDLLQNRGIFQKYNSSEWKAEKGDFWTATYMSVHSIAYNKNLLAADAAPRRYQDLLQERWRGKFAINLGNPTWIYSMLDFFGNEKGMDFLQKFAALNPHPYRGTTLLMQSVIAGDAAAGVALNHDGVIAFINKKAPVALASIQDPLYVDVHGIGILGNAQHPNGARLLVDFIVSKEGQTILADLDKTTVRDDVPLKQAFDRKNFRIVGPEARAKVEDYDKMMIKLFTK
jgi:iron(III) transport system substrate-binding protein